MCVCVCGGEHKSVVLGSFIYNIPVTFFFFLTQRSHFLPRGWCASFVSLLYSVTAPRPALPRRPLQHVRRLRTDGSLGELLEDVRQLRGDVDLLRAEHGVGQRHRSGQTAAARDERQVSAAGGGEGLGGLRF